METNFKLLIVEDDVNVVKTYKRTVMAFNGKQKQSNDEITYKFTVDIATNKSEAIDKITNSENVFNGAIIDLDLEDMGGEDSSGLDVIKYIKNNHRFPVFIISGTIHKLEDEEDIVQNDLYKVIERDAEFNFIEEFIKIDKTGITDILNRTGKIEEFINTIYWNHLSTSLSPWIEGEFENEEEKKQSLIRYCILHLQEYLDLSIFNDRNLSEYHPAEFFITGPIKKSIFTGDIFIYEGNRYVAITPACDFGKKNIKNILCLKISGLSEVSKDLDTINPTKKQIKALTRYLNNSHSPRLHFIPSLKYKGEEFPAGIIDFQNLINYEKSLFEDNNDKVRRVATISHPFLKDLITRFSSYYSRQGAPDFPESKLQKTYLNIED